MSGASRLGVSVFCISVPRTHTLTFVERPQSRHCSAVELTADPCEKPKTDRGGAEPHGQHSARRARAGLAQGRPGRQQNAMYDGP